MGLGSGIIDEIPRVMASRERLPEIASVEARELTEYLERHVGESELLLTGTSHLNPVAMLAGRQMLVGYPGWLWTRGIDYGERTKLMEDFYQNPSRTHDLLSLYPIQYILVDDQVIREQSFSAKPESFDALFEKVFENARYRLYKI